MLVKEKELASALGRSPTHYWRCTLRRAWSEIKEGTMASHNGVLVIDDTVWRKAMNNVASLPSGGRWVAAERREMCMWLHRATNFN